MHAVSVQIDYVGDVEVSEGRGGEELSEHREDEIERLKIELADCRAARMRHLSTARHRYDRLQQELTETIGQRDRALRKLAEIERQEQALPGTTEIERRHRELKQMIPRLQHKEKVHTRHIKGLEENNKELRAEIEQLRQQLADANEAIQVLSLMKAQAERGKALGEEEQ